MLIDAPLLWEQVRLGEDSGLEERTDAFGHADSSCTHGCR